MFNQEFARARRAGTAKKKFGVRCVYSPEAQVFPAKDGSVCERPELDADLRLDCRSGFGTACFVTGAFGFAAAAAVVKLIVGDDVRSLQTPERPPGTKSV